MKERMDKLRARVNLSNIALHEQRHVLGQDLSRQKIRVDFAILFKAIMTMNTAAQQYLKGSGESMLVDARRTVKPVIDVNVEPWSNEKRDRRITKLGILLAWQIRRSVNPADDIPWINLSR